ncbi:MAG: hypothetical protein JZU67_03470, partial [Burkholderiaceae bacterium]|nr:hypothetical protein [Burkholderiaceae bacterium]
SLRDSLSKRLVGTSADRRHICMGRDFSPSLFRPNGGIDIAGEWSADGGVWVFSFYKDFALTGLYPIVLWKVVG